jgi:hypothetical protein
MWDKMWGASAAASARTNAERRLNKGDDLHRHHAAFEALAATLPLGTVGYENELSPKGERLIWLEAPRRGPSRRPARSRRELQRRDPAASEGADRRNGKARTLASERATAFWAWPLFSPEGLHQLLMPFPPANSLNQPIATGRLCIHTTGVEF